MKKVFALMTAVVMGLTACTPGTGATEAVKETKAEGKSSDEIIEITFWDGNWSEESFSKILPLWEAEYPNIKVNAEFQVDKGMSDKYMLAMQNGTAPDVMACALDWVTTFGNAGLLAPMDEFVSKDSLDVSQYVKGAIDTHTINGSLYGLPFRNESFMLFYNKDIFEQEGITKVPETWDEVKIAAEKTTSQNVAGYGLCGANFGNVSFQYITMLGCHGGTVLSENLKTSALDSEAAYQTAQLYKDLSKYAPSSYLENDNVANRTLFAGGKVAMYVSGIYDVPEIVKANPDLNYATTLVPTQNGANRQTILGGWSVAIPKTSKKQEAAWEFVKFITRPDVARLYSNTFTGTGEPSALFDNVGEEILSAGKEGLSYAVALPATPNIVPIRQKIFDAMVLELTGDVTVEEAVSNLNQEVNQLVQQ